MEEETVVNKEVKAKTAIVNLLGQWPDEYHKIWIKSKLNYHNLTYSIMTKKFCKPIKKTKLFWKIKNGICKLSFSSLKLI